MKKRNWKTSLFGISAILGGVVSILKGAVTEGVTAILAGIGLGAAKDHDN